uniref:Syndecan n=1 Tax=Cyprinus carpio TaxID=7962 RepID=A0A8C1TI54_CYPCA
TDFIWYVNGVLVSGQSLVSADDIYLDDQQSGDYPLDDDDFTSGSGSGKDCLQCCPPCEQTDVSPAVKRGQPRPPWSLSRSVIAGGVIGFLFAIFLILLLVYRMRKKDEGSYDLGERKPPSSAYQKAPSKEFYA